MEVIQDLTTFVTSLDSSSGLIVIGIVFGSLLIAYGFFGSLVGADPVGRRYHSGKPVQRRTSFEAGILNNADVDPKGLMKALLPQSREKRTQIRRQLMNAGIVGQNAVAKYYLYRVMLAIVLPAIYLVMLAVGQQNFVSLPEPIGDAFRNQNRIVTYYVLTGLLFVGFFAPALWLRSKVDTRHMEISESFPNALDLMQISLESGLGFDAAMTRVSNEMEVSAPAISQEFRLVQLEVSAGGEREKALLDMANRTNVDEVRSFAAVIMQSIQFGTSVSHALTTYAREMRISRELKAQEMANKLPVKMSLTMSALMLPALLLLILGPIAIRWSNTFG